MKTLNYYLDYLCSGCKQRQYAFKIWSAIGIEDAMEQVSGQSNNLIQLGLWLHLKTNKVYTVKGTMIDCTNATEGRIMVRYVNEDGREFCREMNEFKIKFNPKI